MHCKECGNDLMLSIEPKGWKKIIRLLPLAEYRCLRCGNSSLKLTTSGYRTTAFRILLVALVLTGMAAAIWFSGYGPGPGKRSNENIASMERRAVEPPPAKPTENQEAEQAAEEQALSASQALPTPVETDVDDSTPRMAEAKQASQAEHEIQPRQAANAASQEPAAKNATEQEKTGTAMRVAEANPEPAQKPAPAETKQETPKAEAQNTEPAQKRNPDAPHTLASVQTLNENGEVMVSLLADTPVTAFSKFSLASPPRWVVDLPGRWTYNGRREFGIGSDGIERVRLGVHEDKLRIVIDYEKKEPAEPAVQTMPHGLLVIVR